ncbi:MAG: tRNA guanosine(34) transglycosylase Tgt [Holosporales bacterium]|jgi:queuine tRNA-ribosyltransferase|nr:tRNA guanosine(34) transglycosylase Tgt [Holosporales bacterium]
MMFGFSIIQKSTRSRARLGCVATPHGTIDTPAFIFCATNAAIRGVPIDYVKAAGSQIILSNTYHLMLQPGSDIIRAAGGLHKFIGWDGPMFTDSGGFQIFSLGHGGVEAEIKSSQQRSGKKALINLTEDGAHFRFHINGRGVTLTPELSIETQVALGADIIVSLDECTPYHVNKLYTATSMEKSKRWAVRSLDVFTKLGDGKQALLAVVQGGVYPDLRQESAHFANSNNFHGFAIGGSLGKTKSEMHRVVDITTQMLDRTRYVHLLGIGGIDDIFHGVKCGIDTFDCVTPTRIARHGAAIVKARENPGNPKQYICLENARYSSDFAPISTACDCYTCQHFSRAYIHHLIKSKEVVFGTLISIHNMRTMNRLMEEIRVGITDDALDAVRDEWCS